MKCQSCCSAASLKFDASSHMIGDPASARVSYAAVPFLAFATFVGYGYGLPAIRWLWRLPHHRPWLYVVPDIQGIIVAVAVSVPVVFFFGPLRPCLCCTWRIYLRTTHPRNTDPQYSGPAPSFGNSDYGCRTRWLIRYRTGGWGGHCAL